MANISGKELKQAKKRAEVFLAVADEKLESDIALGKYFEI
jgi:hypothetical protein